MISLCELVLDVGAHDHEMVRVSLAFLLLLNLQASMGQARNS